MNAASRLLPFLACCYAERIEGSLVTSQVKRMVKLQNTKNIKDENFLKGKN